MTRKLVNLRPQRPTERAASMRKPIVKYSKGEIGRVKVVEDFLPSPDRLVLREENVKVTLACRSARSHISSAPPVSAACPISA
jgi:hypothetical protein